MTSTLHRQANAAALNLRGSWGACQGFLSFFTSNLFAEDIPSSKQTRWLRTLSLCRTFIVHFPEGMRARSPAPARSALTLLEAKPRSVTVTPLQSR